MEAIRWIQDNTSPDVRIISVKAPWVVLLADRWAVSFPWVEDEEIVFNFVSTVKPDYVVVGPLRGNRQRYLLPVIKNNSPRFEEVFKAGSMHIYAFY